MEPAVFGLLIGLLIIMLVLLFLQLRPRNEMQEMKDQLVEMKTRQLEAQNQSLIKQTELFHQSQDLLSGQLNSILQAVNDTLSKTQGNIVSQLGQTGTVVGEIQKKLGSLEETTRQIREIGQDISSLQDILQAPKLRGSLGEYLLEDLLRQIFPAENYAMKFSFKNGSQVDAIIKLGGGIVPIDSKFPLESFQRMVKAEGEEEKKKFKREFVRSVRTRIDEVAQKYIRPEEGTFDFAMMYIPAENVFYETVISDASAEKDHEIFDYAIKKRVVPVSPNSFYAYLMAIVYGLKGMRIEQQARQIINQLSGLQEQFAQLYSDLLMTGKHLRNALVKYDDGLKKSERFHDKLVQVTGISGELPELDRQELPEDRSDSDK